MGKWKSNSSSLSRLYVSKTKDVLTSAGNDQACGKSILAQQRSQVTRHVSGSEHIDAVVGLIGRSGRQFLSASLLLHVLRQNLRNFSAFATDLCKALLSAGIPLF
jgi:hypothetical protein